VDAFTIIDYIKTSIEILMNMRMEEYEGDKTNKGSKRGARGQNNFGGDTSSHNFISDTESMRSSVYN
jgi:hypothetical protein